MNTECFRHAMYFGLVLGALFIIHFMFSISDIWVISSLQFLMKLVIPVVAVYFCIDCRKRINDNLFTYSQAFRYFLQLFVAASLICSAFIFMYVKWINVDFLLELKEKTFDSMEKLSSILGSFNITESEMEEALNNAYTTNSFVSSNFLSNIVVGIIVAIVGSFIVRNNKNQS
ncbi:MAG: DUF4199 domain-containing protein [Porphyromonadaceae bacterium]|nr:DUF4199 domain-containing protein [Porphyromonadaceae bacterium]